MIKALRSSLIVPVKSLIAIILIAKITAYCNQAYRKRAYRKWQK